MPSVSSNVFITNMEERNGDFIVNAEAHTDVKALNVLEFLSKREHCTILKIERMGNDESASHSYNGAYIDAKFDRELEAKVFANVFDPEHGDYHEMTLESSKNE